jgi:hypothetical protein
MYLPQMHVKAACILTHNVRLSVTSVTALNRFINAKTLLMSKPACGNSTEMNACDSIHIQSPSTEQFCKYLVATTIDAPDVRKST